jgi:hypothetical protein
MLMDPRVGIAGIADGPAPSARKISAAALDFAAAR